MRARTRSPFWRSECFTFLEVHDDDDSFLGLVVSANTSALGTKVDFDVVDTRNSRPNGFDSLEGHSPFAFWTANVFIHHFNYKTACPLDAKRRSNQSILKATVCVANGSELRGVRGPRPT